MSIRWLVKELHCPDVMGLRPSPACCLQDPPHIRRPQGERQLSSQQPCALVVNAVRETQRAVSVRGTTRRLGRPRVDLGTCPKRDADGTEQCPTRGSRSFAALLLSGSRCLRFFLDQSNDGCCSAWVASSTNSPRPIQSNLHVIDENQANRPSQPVSHSAAGCIAQEGMHFHQLVILWGGSICSKLLAGCLREVN